MYVERPDPLLAETAGITANRNKQQRMETGAQRLAFAR
jgi:hypothetical protein